jgi:hypothetical protein
MYAEKTGVGSVLSPLEMMMPIGSDEPVSLRSFFMLTLSWVSAGNNGFGRIIGIAHAAFDVPRKWLLTNDLRINEGY